MSQSLFDTIIGCMLAALLASVGYAVRRQVTAGDENRRAQVRVADDNRQALASLQASFAEQLAKVSETLAVLNTGASAGARAAINDLREELRAGLRDVNRDVGQLRSEHDALAERHHSLNGTTVQLIERVNGTRELVHELRRDVYRTGSS